MQLCHGVCSGFIGGNREVDIKENRIVSLETFKSYINPFQSHPLSGHERVVTVADSKFLEPMDGREVQDRIYSMDSNVCQIAH